MSSNLEKFIKDQSTYKSFAEVRSDAYVTHKNEKYPLVSVHYGQKNSPALVICGGVHGLERIGAQLCLSLLESFQERLEWDQALHEILKKIQVVFVPLVNPVGYFETTRGNGFGVDLMRNAPIVAEEKTPFLLGGHYYTNRIHWFRGHSVQTETQFVLDLMKNILGQTDCVISVDIHSGFGFKDQLWFPYASSRKHFAQLNEMFLLFELFEKTHPYHIYKIEPQSMNYLTHGDIWDYSFLNIKKPGQVYLPLTLEMGSWTWVKKNPLQIFSKTGLFNPIKEHRINRTLRRHRPFFDFLLHSLYSYHMWTGEEPAKNTLITDKAVKKYYANT